MTSAARAETWEIQRGPSQIGFSVRHALFLQVNGKFRQFWGTVECPDGDFSRGSVDVGIDVGSVSTGHADRDRHLRQEDFFFEDRFPQMRFVSRQVEQISASRYTITGDLTIRGVTREVTLSAEMTDRRSTAIGERIDFRATGRLSRHDFGLRWNGLLEGGEALVSDGVELRLDVALLR